MMFSFNTCRFVLVLAAALSPVSSAEGARGRNLDAVPDASTVELGDAGNYVILAESGISTAPASAITGDIAVSPIAGTAMTGFSFTLNSDGKSSTSDQVTGTAYAASYVEPTPTNLTGAVSNMETAYTDAAGRTNTNATRINYNEGTLGGDYGGADAKLTPGVYTFGSDVNIADDIYFDADGDANAIFIIQMTGNLVQTPNTRVFLTGDAKAENIFWQVAGYVDVGTTAHLEGILLVKTRVTFNAGSTLYYGRVLAQTACVLDTATITQRPA
jgi:hypothetical protein